MQQGSTSLKRSLTISAGDELGHRNRVRSSWDPEGPERRALHRQEQPIIDYAAKIFLDEVQYEMARQISMYASKDPIEAQEEFSKFRGDASAFAAHINNPSYWSSSPWLSSDPSRSSLSSDSSQCSSSNPLLHSALNLESASNLESAQGFEYPLSLESALAWESTPTLESGLSTSSRDETPVLSMPRPIKFTGPSFLGRNYTY